jgi:chromate reductase, NAD(P)H dehydrogenase (quinone)
VPPATRILLITGSTRRQSTNTAALRTVRQLAGAAAEVGPVSTVLYEELAALPAFNPDDDHDPLPPAVAAFRRRIEAADAVLICTPEYAGALPGSFKNLLDWTVGGMEMQQKPVAWLNVAAPGRGLTAHASLATVLGYLGTTVIEPACRSVPVGRDAVDEAGLVTDAAVRAQFTEVITTIAEHVTTARRA